MSKKMEMSDPPEIKQVADIPNRWIAPLPLKPQKPLVTAAMLRRGKAALKELLRRQSETLRVYRPIPEALKFHQSDKYWRLVTGGNRAGKSQAAAAEVSWMATRSHPWYPYPKENFTIYAISHRLKELREVMWPKLAHPGQIKIIRDEHTKKWRPVEPDGEYDKANREKWKDAPPFLPERFIQGGLRAVGWYSRKEDIPAVVPLKGGGTIRFFSSEGKPVKGSSISLAWIDEEIDRELWIPELEARCLDQGGRLFWSFTPEVATPMAMVMHQRAIDPLGRHEITEFSMLLKDNPYVPEEVKRRFRAGLRTQREIDTKWHGLYALQGYLVYPEYSEDVHHCEAFDIPDTWSRWMIVDPGVHVCAVLFAAKPPTWQKQMPDGRLLAENESHPDAVNIGHEMHLFGELYIRRCKASDFGKQVKEFMGEKWAAGGYQGFVIDNQMARQQEFGSGRTIDDHYSEALEENGVWSQMTDNGFIAGSNDKKARESALRGWLELHPETARPILRVHKGKCPMFDWEMPQQRYKAEIVNGTKVVTEKRITKDDHLCTGAEYLADLDPEWTKPKQKTRSENAIVRKAKELMRRRISDTVVSFSSE